MDPPPNGPPRPRRRLPLRALVVLGVLVVLGAAAAALGFALRPADGDVRAAVQNFVQAFDRQDDPGLAAALCAEEAVDVTEDDDFDVGSGDGGEPTPAPPPVDIGVIDVRGDVASATVLRPGDPPVTLTLLRENGVWKVCAPAADRFASTPP